MEDSLDELLVCSLEAINDDEDQPLSTLQAKLRAAEDSFDDKVPLVVLQRANQTSLDQEAHRSAVKERLEGLLQSNGLKLWTIPADGVS